MEKFTQLLQPVADNLYISALVALIPIVFYLVTLAGFKVKGWLTGLLTLVVAIVIACVFFKMPFQFAAFSTFQGMVYGAMPIGWIILTSVFLYKMTVKTGHFDIIRDSITSLTDDRRLQALIIAFSFGAFLEGAAGFGAPVAITASLLVGLGFKPLYAAGVCTIANTAPVAFGAVGAPVTAMDGLATYANGSPIAAAEIAAMIGRQLPLVSIFIPFYLVLIMAGFKKTLEVWPALLVSGGSYSVTQFIFLNFVGPELVNVSSAIVSLLALIIFLKFWTLKNILVAEAKILTEENNVLTAKKIVRAWTPFILLTLFVTIINLGFFKQLIQASNPKTGQKAGALNSLIFNFPYYIDGSVARVAPIVKQPTPIKAVFSFAPFTSTTTAILLAAIVTIIIFRVRSRIVLLTIKETALELWAPILTICSVLAFA